MHTTYTDANQRKVTQTQFLQKQLFMRLKAVTSRNMSNANSSWSTHWEGSTGSDSCWKPCLTMGRSPRLPAASTAAQSTLKDCSISIATSMD